MVNMKWIGNPNKITKLKKFAIKDVETKLSDAVVIEEKKKELEKDKSFC
jgi:hypothetical protein